MDQSSEDALRRFVEDAAELEKLMSVRRDVAVTRLRALHEMWARTLLGIGDEGELVSRVRSAVEAGVDRATAGDAIEHLKTAEDHQWDIGTWASGSGEGLASMFEVRTLQLARAWLWLTQSPDGGAARWEARKLLDTVVGDPNGMSERLKAHSDALAARLAAD